MIGGTSVFFLLRGCGVDPTAGCTRYPAQIYALLPAPSLAITALLVHQAVVATIRGRLLLAIESALAIDLKQTYLLGGGPVPIYSTYHFQQQMNHEARGTMLWTILMCLPLVLLVGMVYYCGLELYGVGRWTFYGGYAFLMAMIAWSGLPVLRGFHSLDSFLHDYMHRRKAEEAFRL